MVEDHAKEQLRKSGMNKPTAPKEPKGIATRTRSSELEKGDVANRIRSKIQNINTKEINRNQKVKVFMTHQIGLNMESDEYTKQQVEDISQELGNDKRKG